MFTLWIIFYRVLINVSGDLTQTEFLNRLSNRALSDSKISELSREKLSSGMLGSSSWFKTAQCCGVT